MTARNKPMRISEKLEIIDFDCRPLDDVLIDLLAFKEKYSEKYLSLEFNMDIEYGYYDSQVHTLRLVGYRMETEEEAQARIDREDARKQQALARERETYEKLKRKFEER